MLVCMDPSSPPVKRTLHLLKTPDILLANDSRRPVSNEVVIKRSSCGRAKESENVSGENLRRHGGAVRGADPAQNWVWLGSNRLIILPIVATGSGVGARDGFSVGGR